jgi:hypothetical protein
MTLLRIDGVGEESYVKKKEKEVGVQKKGDFAYYSFASLVCPLSTLLTFISLTI